MTTAADQIRAAMSETEWRSAKQISAATGFSVNVVCQFLTYGYARRMEVLRTDKRPYLYKLNPDHVPAEKMTKPDGRSHASHYTLHRSAIQQVLAANRLLRVAIRNCVENVEAVEEIGAAIEMQERAEAMALAVIA